MDDWPATVAPSDRHRLVTAMTMIGLAGDLAALEPRAGEAMEAVARARDWLLAASMERGDSRPEELRDEESAYEPVLACRRAAEELEQARDGVPPEAAADYAACCRPSVASPPRSMSSAPPNTSGSSRTTRRGAGETSSRSNAGLGSGRNTPPPSPAGSSASGNGWALPTPQR